MNEEISIDLRNVTREDVENIKNPTLRLAVINALFLQTTEQSHTNHNSHSNHTLYSQSIKEQLTSENILDFVFGTAEK